MPSSYGLLPTPYYQGHVACKPTCQVYPIRRPSQGTLDDKPPTYPHMGRCMFGGRGGHETHAPHITDQHNLGIQNYVVLNLFLRQLQIYRKTPEFGDMFLYAFLPCKTGLAKHISKFGYKKKSPNSEISLKVP